MATIKVEIEGPKLTDVLPLPSLHLTASEHAEKLAESCASLLLSRRAESYVGEVITITVDGEDGPAFEIVVSTQKVGATTPHERAALMDHANKVWQEKTDWVQKTCTGLELGKHRADVLRERIEALEADQLHRMGTIGLQAADIIRLNDELVACVRMLNHADTALSEYQVTNVGEHYTTTEVERWEVRQRIAALLGEIQLSDQSLEAAAKRSEKVDDDRLLQMKDDAERAEYNDHD